MQIILSEVIWWDIIYTLVNCYMTSHIDYEISEKDGKSALAGDLPIAIAEGKH